MLVWIVDCFFANCLQMCMLLHCWRRIHECWKYMFGLTNLPIRRSFPKTTLWPRMASWEFAIPAQSIWLWSAEMGLRWSNALGIVNSKIIWVLLLNIKYVTCFAPVWDFLEMKHGPQSVNTFDGEYEGFTIHVGVLEFLKTIWVWTVWKKIQSYFCFCWYV